MNQVFISHGPSNADRELSRKLADALDEAGLKVWLDVRQVFPGDNWARKVADGLRSSSAMVVLVSREALDAQMIERDLQYALTNKQYRSRIVTLIVGPESDDLAERVPWILTHLDLPIVKLEPMGEARALKKVVDALKKAA